MKARNVAITVAILTYMALAAYAALYLAGALYFVTLKTWPPALEAGTFLALWDQLGHLPAQRKKLQGCAGIAFIVLYVVPLLIASQLSKRTRPLHGDARFARPGEVRQAGLHAEKGVIVGQADGEYLVFGGQQFVLLAAPTRSGKGVGVVIPNLLNWPDSVVVLDIKRENFGLTSGFRAQHGQAVYLFSPFDTEFKSHRWNPLDAVNRDPTHRVGDLMAIAATFWPSESGTTSSNEAFFNDQAQSLFLGLALYLLETPELPCTLGELLRQGSGKGRSVQEHLRSIVDERRNGPRALSGECIDALNRFLSASDNTLASIKSTFEAPLLIFANPIVDAATAASDFDMRELRRKPISLYVHVKANRLASASKLLNLFFAQLVQLNTDTLPEQDPTLKHQVLLIMDEFTSMGRVSIIDKSVAFIAGYGLRLLPIVQSIEQLEQTYGKEAARNFVKNHALKVVYPPDDVDDAERVSKTLGYLTEKATSQGQSRSAQPGRGASVSRSENTSDQRRALLLPQEVRELPQTQEIVLLEHCKPILCEKVRYYEDRTFIDRLKVISPSLRALGTALPTKAQLDHAALVSAELSAPVPTMDVHGYRAISEGRTRAVQVDEIPTLDLNRLAIDTSAITDFSGDPENPSREEAAAVVSSFFAQLGWEDEATVAQLASDDDDTEDEAPPPPTRTAGRIDLAVLEL